MPLKLLVSLVPIAALYLAFGPFRQYLLIHHCDFLTVIFINLIIGFVLSLIFRAISEEDEGRGLLTLLAFGYFLSLIVMGLLTACFAGAKSHLS